MAILNTYIDTWRITSGPVHSSKMFPSHESLDTSQILTLTDLSKEHMAVYQALPGHRECL